MHLPAQSPTPESHQPQPSRSPLSPAFLLLVLAQFISLVGTQMSVVAIPWFVLSTTGSPGRMVAVMLAETLPLALFGAFSGVVVDQTGYKPLMISLDVARGLITLLIPALALAGRLRFGVILLVSAAGGLLATPYVSARTAMVPALIGEDEKRLTAANSLLQLSMQSSMVVGPALAGLLVARLGNLNVVFLDALSYLLAAALIALVPGARRAAATGGGAGGASRAAELRAGLRFIWQSPLLQVAIAIAMFVQLGMAILLQATLPVFVKQTLGGNAGQVGLLLSAFGGGSTLGMVVYGLAAARWPWRRGTTIRGFMLGAVLPLLLLPTLRSLPGSLAALGLSGLFVGPASIVVFTLLQTDTPAPLRGRVFAAFFALWMAMTPAGLAVAGPMLERFGPLPVLWGAVLLLAATLLTTWSSRVVREA